jgi:putative transposase
MMSLSEFIASNPDPRELKRALATSMTLQGYMHREIMQILQVSSGFISKCKKAFLSKGIDGLKLAYKGSKGYLTSEQKQQVLDWLRKKNYWNLSELEFYVLDQFEVTFEAKSSYHDIFHEAGISWKKTQKANPKRDQELVDKKKRK